MAQTQISIRMDAELKQDFEAVCEELGFNMSTAITILAKKMTRERRIPFDVSVDPFYSAAHQRRLAESAGQLAEGRTVVKTMEELLHMEAETEEPENE